MVNDIVKNNKRAIKIPTIRLEIVVKPKRLATKSRTCGTKATMRTINEHKYHNKEYFTGMRPFFTTIVVIRLRTSANPNKKMRKTVVTFYTSLFPQI